LSAEEGRNETNTQLKRRNEKMKKAALLSAMLLLAIAFQMKSVDAVSSGYERFIDDESEVYLEYLPIVPYNPSYPTASEEFAIKFHIWQKSWWVVPALCKRFPRGFEIKVYYRDDSCDYSDYVTWKRWYPTSTSQYGLTVSWTLGGTHGPLTISQEINAPDVFGYDRNYDEYSENYGGKTYLHLSDLSATYRSNWLWGATDVYGAGSIGIPNDMAQGHQGHHVLIWVHVRLRWLDFDWWGHYEYDRHYDFILGDDIPADTDSWLTVEDGTVVFGNPFWLTISTGSGGTTEPSPGTYVYDEGTAVTVTASAYSGYTFNYWLRDGATVYGNPITVTMDSDHTVRAYFRYTGGGGGPICPTLFVWDGSDYTDLGVIDIHADEDVVREVSVATELVGINNHKAEFRLREGWEGLTYSHSQIDQVKLYAVDSDGNWRLSPLVNATHSELGNVLPQLLLSDDTRIDLYLLETIDLKFMVPGQTDEIQEFAFVIEGCNMLKY